MKKSIAAVLVCLLFTALLCACTDKGNGLTKKTASGIWWLTSVDGKPLQQAYDDRAAEEGVTLEELLEELEITKDWIRDGGSLTLDKNGTAIFSIRYMGKSAFFMGEWKLEGDEVVLTQDGEERGRLQYRDGALEMKTKDGTLTYTN